MISIAILVLTQAGCGRVWPGRFLGTGGNALVATPTPSPTPLPTAVLSVSGPILADGSDVAVVSVTLNDGLGMPMSGVTPTLSVSGIGNSVSCGITNASGLADCTVSSSFAETKLINITSPQAQALAVSLPVLSTTAFRYTWNAPALSPTATLPLIAGKTYDIHVYWGDGQSHHITDPADPNRIHTYAGGGIKTILIHGTFSELAFSTDPDRLRDVVSWGTQSWTSMKDMFKNCTSLATYSAAGAPVTSAVTDFSGMFEGASNFNGDISTWNTQSATTLARMFKGAANFNAPIGVWNVSNVTNFSEMFSAAGIPASPTLLEAEPAVPMTFNQGLSNWDVGNATNMSRMFAGAISFNSLISNWSTGNVTDMSLMFYYAKAFNASLDTVNLGPAIAWDVSKVTSMKMMFFRAQAFNSTLNVWTPTMLTSMERMFAHAVNFNQPLSWGGLGSTPALTNLSETFYGAASLNSVVDIDVSKVTTFYRTFAYANSFDQPLGTWTPGCGIIAPQTVNMSSVFAGAVTFNQPLNQWGTCMERVANLSYMFSGATAFNQVLFDWVTSNVTTMESMFQNASSFNRALTPGASGRWDTSKVTNLTSTFNGASAFNNGVPAGDGTVVMNWNTANVTSMLYTFYYANAFNSNISGWNTSKVTNFVGMFVNCFLFNQNVGSWDISKATTIASMFYNAQNFNQDVSDWQTQNVTSMSRVFIGASNFNNGDSCGTSGGTMGGVVGFPNNWNTAKVTDMSRMFEDALCFNQQLFFDTRLVTNMYNMFNNAPWYNQPMPYVNGPTDFYWSTGSVVNMKGMFARAIRFNQPLHTWDVSKVKNFNLTFYQTPVFDQPLSSWVTSSATNMSGMFINAAVYNQDLSMWDVDQVTIYTDFSTGANAAWPAGLKPPFSGAGGLSKRVFITAATFTGDLGGTAGADQHCMNDSKYPGTGVFKALLGSSIVPLRTLLPAENDWVILSLTQYVRTDGNNVVMSNAAKQFSGAYTNPLDSVYVGEYWSGLSQLWNHSGNECNGWTSGDAGLSATFGHTADWSESTGTCDMVRPLLCVEQ